MGCTRLSILLLLALYHSTYTQETSENLVSPDPAEQKDGITTLNLQEGNWFIKRQILEKTMDLIESINTLFTSILESRMSFLTSRDKANREFDTFSKNTGFELGDLLQMITSFMTQMEKERQKMGELSLEQRSFLTSMQDKETILNAMHASLAKISDMDAAIDDVLLQIEQEINKSHEEQTKALVNFRTIKMILDDQKAEQLYLSTKNIFENMQEIQKYINGQLTTYFENNVTQLKNIMQSTATQLESFKQEGVDLKKTLEDFINKDALQQQQIEKQKIQEALNNVKKTADKPSIATTLYTVLKRPFEWILEWWHNK